MKKILKNLFLAVTVAVLCFVVGITASAETQKEGYYSYEVYNGRANITDVDTAISGDVVIPDTLGGAPVVEIESWAFFKCESITSIEIPDTVKIIDYSAFEDCTKLKSIVFPEGVEIIRAAFENCVSLENITIPASVKSLSLNNGENLKSITVDNNNRYYSSDEYGVLFDKNKTTLIMYPSASSMTSYVIPATVTSISSSSFLDCEKLESVTIPNNVNTIEYSAFANCISLENITIPDTAISIVSTAFVNTAYYNTDSNWDNGVLYIGNHLIKAEKNTVSHTVRTGTKTIADSAFSDGNLSGITIPDGVVSIGDDAFDSCERLTSVVIPDSVTYLGESAFSGCKKLKSVVIGKGVPAIDQATFSSCSSIESVVIGDNVKSIAWCAFYGCSSLKDVIISDSVEFIDSNAFSECKNLESIKIGKGLKSLGAYPFENSGSIMNITVDSDNKYFSNDETGVLFNKDKTSLVLYNKGSLRTVYEIPDTVTAIEGYSFEGSKNLEEVIIPYGVTRIGDRAFFDCTALRNISIPESVSDIEGYAFRGCSSLESIAIPDCEISIGGYAFEYTAYYDNASNWENGVLYIGNHLIKAEETISGSYEIKKGTKTIAGYAFDRCEKLTGITIPEGVMFIGAWAFNGTDIQSLSLPESVTVIGEFAFSGDFSSVQISKNVKSIGRGAFHCAIFVDDENPFYSSDEDGVLFNKNKTTLLSCNVKGYWSSSYYIVPDGVTCIGESAFGGCGSETVVLSDTVTVIEKGAFSGAAIRNIVIFDSLQSIGDYAFDYTCSHIRDVYYTGTQEQWKNISIGANNSYLTSSWFHYETHVHKYKAEITPPTCTEEGYTTNTCECGHSYKDDYTYSTGHSFNDDDVCERCGFELEKNFFEKIMDWFEKIIEWFRSFFIFG